MKRSLILLALVPAILCGPLASPAHAAPAMRIKSVTASPHVVISAGIITFRVTVKGLKLDIRHMGKKAAAGHGHLQYYLDRVPSDARTRADRKAPFLAAVATPLFSFNLKASPVKISRGTHRIIVALARNNDVLYPVPTKAITITVR